MLDFENKEKNMKKITKLTFMTVAMLLLSAYSVTAQEVDTEPAEQTTEYFPIEEPYTGFTSRDGVTYYHMNNIPITSQWKEIDGKVYYFNEEGIMQKNAIVDGYLINHLGTRAKNESVVINGQIFYADANGKMLRSVAVEIDGKMAYFNEKGERFDHAEEAGLNVKNTWIQRDGNWYYADENGDFLRNNWRVINGKWYAFHANGVMYENEWNGNYYLRSDGSMADNEWIFDKNYNSWFFLKPGGKYAQNEWNGSYYLKSGGYMAKSEWIFDKNYSSWYYLQKDGAYASNKWLLIKGKWYHFRYYGEMDANKWIGSYYVQSDGSMR